MHKAFRMIAVLMSSLLVAAETSAQITVLGADGSDGAYTASAGATTINLANSPSAAWDAANPDPGTPLTGVYDADKWAVVFRYSAVNIPANATINFTNHPSRAPVVWLVDGNVTIAGTLSVAGKSPTSTIIQAEPGPGGFRGGLGNLGIDSPQSGGFGIGGTKNLANDNNPWGASHGTAGMGGSGPSSAGLTYGNANLLPLIGGSGGTGFLEGPNSPTTYAGGGGGGGAILIAATGTITVTGTISAQGGSGIPHWASSGSGGAIRLVGNEVSGTSILNALGGPPPSNGGPGGAGRIRIETNLDTGGLTGTPAPSYNSSTFSTATVWPDTSAPIITVSAVHTQSVPSDPRASLNPPFADVNLTNPNPLDITVQGTNVPLNATVTVRIVPKRGQDFIVTASFISGDLTNSIWKAEAQLPNGFSAIQARAVWP